MPDKIKIDQDYIYRLISNNLKRLRARKNISQMNLALDAGLTHNFINDIENCKKGISAKTLAKLSVALEVEPYCFFMPDFLPDNALTMYVKEVTATVHNAVDKISYQYLFGDKKPEDE